MLRIRQCEPKSIKSGAEKPHSSLAYLFKLLVGGEGVEKDKTGEKRAKETSSELLFVCAVQHFGYGLLLGV